MPYGLEILEQIIHVLVFGMIKETQESIKVIAFTNHMKVYAEKYTKKDKELIFVFKFNT